MCMCVCSKSLNQCKVLKSQGLSASQVHTVGVLTRSPSRGETANLEQGQRGCQGDCRLGIYLVGDQEHSGNSGVRIAVEFTEEGCRQGSSLDSCLLLVARMDQPEVESLEANVNIQSQQLMQEERE